MSWVHVVNSNLHQKRLLWRSLLCLLWAVHDSCIFCFQIETNRNTALTLACFQGRHEVVSLLVDRRANIEHRAKTGLTPLMEAASGGYVEVGRVLLEKGADVNAPPVPSSRDTALTIAADKGHNRFVDLLLSRWVFGCVVVGDWLYLGWCLVLSRWMNDCV